MSRRLDRPAAACTLVVSLTALWAGALPGTARADDGLEEPLASVTALTEAASSATEDALTAAAASEVATATEPIAPVEPDTPIEQIATTGETADAAPLPQPAPSEEPAEVTEPSEPPAPAPAEAPSADTTPDTADITADTPPPDPDPAPTAPDSQEEDGALVPTPPTNAVPSSTNVNVSVRINSPGDNGAVTQLNVTATVPQPASPDPAPAPQSTKPATPPAPEQAVSAPDAAGSSDTWYWSWDCLDMAPFSPISPAGSGAASVPSSWTWIWNCAGNDTQYRGETPGGFRQENTNISIRFGSPGNDGAVSQVNVAVSLPIAAGARVTQQDSASSISTATPTVVSLAPIAPGLGDAPGFPAVISPSNATDIALPAPLVTAPVDVALPVFGAAASPAAAGPAPILGVAPGVPFGIGPRTPWAGGTSADRRPVGATTGWGSADTTLLEGARAASRPVSADAAGRASLPPAAKAAPSSRKSGTDRPPPRDPVPPTPLSGASAAAASSGGSSGSGLPFLLALPFVAAMLDLARRVAFERATWPSGHRRRVPDEPG